MKKSTLRAIIAATTLGLFSIGTALAEIAVIVNSGNASSSMSADDVKAVFLGKSTALSAVDQAEGSAIRNTFYSKIAGKDESQMKAFWSTMIFSGKAVPPEGAADSATVKAWVAKKPNGIGYIDSSAVDGSVKVVLKIN